MKNVKLNILGQVVGEPTHIFSTEKSVLFFVSEPALIFYPISPKPPCRLGRERAEKT